MTLWTAIDYATQAHAGQVDQAGRPYMHHPLRVMERVDGYLDRVVAVLHDVLEDTEATAATLPFEATVVEAVVALTRLPGEAYAAYLERVMANPIAHRVKLADVADNADPARLALLPAEQAARLAAKYAHAAAVLARIEG